MSRIQFLLELCTSFCVICNSVWSNSGLSNPRNHSGTQSVTAGSELPLKASKGIFVVGTRAQEIKAQHRIVEFDKIGVKRPFVELELFCRYSQSQFKMLFSQWMSLILCAV